MKQVLGESQQLDSQITAESSWEWARNPQNQGALEDFQTQVRVACSPLHKRFLTEDPAKLKKEIAKDHLTKELEKFVKLKPKIDELDKFITRLKDRHTC